MIDRKIRILIADSSPVKRLLYRNIFEDNSLMTVVSEYRKGQDAAQQAAEHNADIIVMGLELCDMDGYRATSMILETLATPIILVCDKQDPDIENKAVKAGALAVAETPDPNSPNFETQKKTLIDTVMCMSEVKVVTRRMNRFFQNLRDDRIDSGSLKKIEKIAFETTEKKRNPIIAIGVSTGGPPLIGAMLSEINRNFAHPICLIQHISKDFTQSMVSWLSTQSVLPVHNIETDMKMLGGNVYIAPGGSNTIVTAEGTFKVIPPLNNVKPTPSIDVFFNSLMNVYGKDVIAILLTGMGSDGAEGLKALKESGAHTIIQDKDSCIIYGMPAAAKKIDAAKSEMTPAQIIKLLNSL